MVHDSCHGQREVCHLRGVLMYVQLCCNKALVFSSGPNAYCEPTGNYCILTYCIFLLDIISFWLSYC